MVTNSASQKIRVIDSHTGGEPTRVILTGGPDLGHSSVGDQLRYMHTNHDRFRAAMVTEPRGSELMVGALLVPPANPTCAFGVIFFNNVGYLGMCGHGTIGLITTLAYLGRIQPGNYLVETAVGIVSTRLLEDGSVMVRNVPCYRKVKGAIIHVDGIGSVCGDVAWGGNWFFLTDQLPCPITVQNIDRLTDHAWRIRRAVNAQGYPEVDHVELSGPPSSALYDSRNFVLCPGKAYDRSPCGTGTSAKLACLAADGLLKPGATWNQESVIGSSFSANYSMEAEGIIPTIQGRAFVMADSEMLLQSDDPFCWGIGT